MAISCIDDCGALHIADNRMCIAVTCCHSTREYESNFESQTLTPQTTMTYPPTATPTPVQCPQEGNSSISISLKEKGPVINFNPISIHYLNGDIIQVNGTTNLPSGEH